LKPVGGKVKLTTSIGIASSDENAVSDAKTLIDAADEAMYVSKAKGKNCFSVFPPDEREKAIVQEYRKRTLAATSDR
jgi:predicted signal transduction protein with EAL and GGDEF domain